MCEYLVSTEAYEDGTTPYSRYETDEPDTPERRFDSVRFTEPVLPPTRFDGAGNEIGLDEHDPRL